MRRFLLIAGDIVIFYASLFLTLWLRYGGTDIFGYNLRIHLLPFSIIFLIWTVVFYTANLYDISFTKNNLRLFSAFFYTKAINTLIVIAFFYLVPFFRIAPRTNFFIFLVIELSISIPWRYYFNKIIARKGFNNNTLILGLNEESQELYDYLLANTQLGYNTLGIIDVEHSTAPDILEKIIEEKNVKTVLIGPSVYKIPRIIDVLYRLVKRKINFHNMSDFFERMTGKVPLRTIDQSWFLENLSEGSKRTYEIAKRILDIGLSVIIGIVILPFIPFIILAIKLDSEGPLFYFQQRVGRAGRIFTLVKFRNMVNNAEGLTGPIWASEEDSRVTRVGKFLRRSRIDEIPQIFNIIKGDMSFIGPRPERPEFHEKLKKEIPFYEERYLIKPGLTGWAQTKFKLDFRGGLTINDVFEKLQYDLYYIKNRSLLLDAAVVLKTFNIILKKLFK